MIVIEIDLSNASPAEKSAFLQLPGIETALATLSFRGYRRAASYQQTLRYEVTTQANQTERPEGRPCVRISD